MLLRDRLPLVSCWSVVGDGEASGPTDSRRRTGWGRWHAITDRGVCTGVVGRSESRSGSAGRAVTAWATAQQMPVDKVVTEVGSAFNEHRRKFLSLLRDPSVHRIVVEHRDRFCRLGSKYVQAAFAAQGRELVVVDSAEVDDDLVRDMTEILTSMCARLYGKRAAENRTKRALAAAAGEDHEAA